MIHAYQCEARGEQFTPRAALAEKERVLHARFPLCSNREVNRDFASVAAVRSGGCCGQVPFRGPGSGAGCC